MKHRGDKTPIIITSGANGRAVIFGYADTMPEPGDVVHLTDARMVLYWSAECGGLLGLAANGPKNGTRLTPAVPEVRDTCVQVIAVSAEAAAGVAAWK